jgi:uncharacterized membrane protein
MKLMIAKIVYWTMITLMIGLALGLAIALAWFTITTIPFAFFVLLGALVLVGFGLLMGWAETVIEKDKRYKSSGEKVRR